MPVLFQRDSKLLCILEHGCGKWALRTHRPNVLHLNRTHRYYKVLWSCTFFKISELYKTIRYPQFQSPQNSENQAGFLLFVFKNHLMEELDLKLFTGYIHPTLCEFRHFSAEMLYLIKGFFSSVH